MRKVKKVNVGMIFDEDSVPIAIYWKNGMLKHYSVKEMDETHLDQLWEADKVENENETNNGRAQAH